MQDKTKLKTTPFSAGDYIENAEDVIGYLDIVLEDNDSLALRRHLSVIAKSRGMTELAKTAGISRAGLYKALGDASDPQMSTIFSILDALGLKISVTKKDSAAA